jgi:hypothetical protein
VFVAFGVISGLARVSAESADRVVDESTVDYDEADPPPPLTLVAHRRRELHGEVLSALGPVACAEVMVSAVDPLASRLIPTTTGADGAFTSSLTQQAAGVDVIELAQGFSSFSAACRERRLSPFAATPVQNSFCETAFRAASLPPE